ncbi:rRNA methyltransferase 1, mitochondrial [Apodemus speciosus]|uniref:rRNA methyltransferase 1, mitochondrial n=1 Tax=Apodemus speciosus TaxID=105296 RepID=A0ABQ0FBH2_APOSI
MRLLRTVACFDRLIAHFSSVARRGERPGGEELSRLLLDDLAPAQRLERLFGLSPCLLALRAARRRVARLLLQAGKAGLQGERAELLRVAEARGIPVLRPRRQKLDALCGYQVHQGVCMEQLWLVLEGCPLTPVVSKASAGAMEVMDVFATPDLPGFLQAKAQQGWLVVGTVGCPGPEISQSSKVPITSCLEFVWDRPTLLVLGNEGSGLSQEVFASCQLLLTILPRRPLPPGLESLNVSVATGILLHSICSQKKGFPGQERGPLLQDS